MNNAQTVGSRITTDYAEGVTRVAALQALDTDAVNPLCRTQWLSRGSRAAQVVVFVHGFTNCPQQFKRIAQSVFERGSNVLNARMPRHGMRDRLTREMDGLTAAELTAWTTDLLDLAHGLGERVTLVGLSLGGTLVLWAAQTRPDLDRAIAIAPMIMPPNLPRAVVRALVPVALSLPNFYVWWDNKLRAAALGPQHAYPGFPSRALAAIFRIAVEVERAAMHPGALPEAHEVVLVSNAADVAVDGRASKEIIARWQANGAKHAEVYEFAAELNLLHDLVDETQVRQRTDIVYPVLLNLICRPAV